MSFILDALRKSDNERRRQAAPALAAIPQAAPVNKRSIWLPVLAIILAINALIFSYVFLNRNEPAPVAVTTGTSTPEVRSLRKEPLANTGEEEETDTLSTTPPAKRVPAETKPIVVKADPVVVTDAVPTPTKTIREDLPSLGQMRAAGLVSVGNMHLDMHVYSSDAEKRFVFVNMVKYREGEQLTEGPTIEEITPDGVIMVQQGNRFRLIRD